MVMGILVVLIVGGLAYRYFQNKSGLADQGSETALSEGVLENESLSGDENVSFENGKINHTVSKGENLWQIAEKYFKSGYNWVDIVEENNIQNPDILSVGQKLVIPGVEPRKLTIAAEPVTEGEALTITSDKYQVQKGDYLSLIAKNAYGKGSEWVRIWEANKDEVVNPNLIFPGQGLRIPR
ncbi:LysM peptidoglycan-binding domain-containing protein [Patescibacteria group bacterium]|nr:LysM peptidoglycan-binding domain-containing protein [Patescibacteria group bacterium]